MTTTSPTSIELWHGIAALGLTVFSLLNSAYFLAFTMG
jgi:hypothetical protein